MTSTPHKHAALIKQWADGAEIEEFSVIVGWFTQSNPTWDGLAQYRIKDPYRHLKEAATNPAKKIGILQKNGGVVWYTDTTQFGWVLDSERYVIGDKPDPYSELKAAAADPTKQIRLKEHGPDDWQPGDNWSTEDGKYEFAYLPDQYEIRDKPDPYRHLKAAAQDPTKQVRVGSGPWMDSGEYDWSWSDPVERYQIRDKPKPKKQVKLLAWFDGTALFWRVESRVYPDSTRVPSEDKVIEVGE